MCLICAVLLFLCAFLLLFYILLCKCSHSLLEDKNAIKALGKLLGKTDKTGQIREITLVESLIKAQIEKAEIEKNKNVKLYKTLGTVSGIGISIILI